MAALVNLRLALHDDLAIWGDDIEARPLTGEQLEVDLFLISVPVDDDLLDVVIIIEQFLGRITEGLQQNRSGKFAAPVDPDVEDVFMVEIEIEPGPPVGNDPGVVQNLAARMGLTLVVIEKDPGRAVQLADDDPLGSVDDEGTVFGHQRNFAEIDLLLLDIADRLNPRFLVDIPGNQAYPNLHGGGKGHPPLMTLVHIVFGSPEGVGNILQGADFAEITNRKNGAENRFQTDILPG